MILLRIAKTNDSTTSSRWLLVPDPAADGTTSGAYPILSVGLVVKPSWIRSDMVRNRHAAAALTLQSLGQTLSMDGLAADNVLDRQQGDFATAMTAFLASHVMRSMLAAGYLPVFLMTHLVYQADNRCVTTPPTARVLVDQKALADEMDLARQVAIDTACASRESAAAELEAAAAAVA
ncbi:hypothetical protein JKP88DRAFT_275849 [Tribonema minus]|uniref:Uncharacterized protein n=1 Tax=Tribonema minus TaxID=303371 RepID=A0A836CJ17_9STRA|nr:hypothetical protein JKP88DRAFT_275849 [Tribonema minus]